MKTSFQLMVYYFNFTGVLNVTCRNYDLKLSKRWIFYNFLKIFLMTAAKFTISPSILTKNLRQEPNDEDGITKFLTTMVFVVRYQLTITAPICFCVSIWKLKQILNFIEACKRIFYIFELSTSSNEWKELTEKSRRTLFILLLLSFFMRLIYFLTIFKTTWQAAMFFFIFHWHNNIVYNLIVFVSLFFPYFLFLLRTLNAQIDKFNDSGQRNYLDYDMLASKFLQLHHLIKKFNGAFGLILSIITEFVIFAITFCVSFHYLNKLSPDL